ncbi:MAG: hypothetical protein JWN70_4414 [Planctomycetaceae bacterium]|nr:hypothetical protein [Planctomycetaceae bacterium]
MEIRLCVEAWERAPEIPSAELVQRLLRQFPDAVIDWAQGDAYVQAGLDRLIGLGAPDIFLNAHRLYFGKVVFVSLSEPRWAGATATSYLHNTSPPLGDAVIFDVDGAEDESTVDLIARELGAALGMARYFREDEEDEEDTDELEDSDE